MKNKDTQFFQESPYYPLMEAAIWHIHENPEADLSFKALARKFRVSEFHFQRMFKRWVGVSPLQYLQYLKLQRARKQVRSKSSLAAASHASGLSSSGRLHELFVKLEGMTPLQYKRFGDGLEIAYGVHDTVFGKCLLGVSDRGVCFLSFLRDEKMGDALREQKARWEKARFVSDPVRTGKVAKEIFSRGKKPVSLLVKGTHFQVKVWEALLKIPSGETASYKQVATSIGKWDAERAVGSACGRNDLAFLIPCHRVLTSAGALGGYRWDEKRKLAMLEWERIQAR